jgi:hypothetical protein
MMDNALRSLVRRRAGDVCEYCRLPQAASGFDSMNDWQRVEVRENLQALGESFAG